MHSASDCGPSSELVHIDELSFSPDSISVPGNLTVNAKVTLDKDLQAPISGKFLTSFLTFFDIYMFLSACRKIRLYVCC